MTKKIVRRVDAKKNRPVALMATGESESEKFARRSVAANKAWVTRRRQAAEKQRASEAATDKKTPRETLLGYVAFLEGVANGSVEIERTLCDAATTLAVNGLRSFIQSA